MAPGGEYIQAAFNTDFPKKQKRRAEAANQQLSTSPIINLQLSGNHRILDSVKGELISRRSSAELRYHEDL